MECNTKETPRMNIAIDTMHGTVTGDISTYNDYSTSDNRRFEISLIDIMNRAEQEATDDITKREIKGIKESMKSIGQGTLSFISSVLSGVITNEIDHRFHP